MWAEKVSPSPQPLPALALRHPTVVMPCHPNLNALLILRRRAGSRLSFQTSEHLKSRVQTFRASGITKCASVTADNIRRLLTIISGTSLSEPTLSPFSGGGVALTCSAGNRSLTFTAYPDHGDFVFSRNDENDELVDDGIIRLDHNGQLSAVIAAFLAR